MSTHSTPTGKFTDVKTTHFQGGAHLHDGDDDSLGNVLRHQRARHRGVIPSARIPFSAQPTNADTLTIGASAAGVFHFLTTLIAATTYTQVKRGSDAAHTLANLIAAVNGDTSNTNWVEATTPFAGKVLADAPTATSFRIRKALARGLDVVPGIATSTALSASITAGGSWDRANLSATGKKLEDQDYSVIRLTITAAMVTATAVTVELPFDIGSVIAQSNAGNLSWSDSTLTITIDDGNGNVLAADDEVLAVAYA